MLVKYLLLLNMLVIESQTYSKKLFLIRYKEKIVPSTKYFPSIYDPLAIKKYPKLLWINGFIKSHNNDVVKQLTKSNYFGNFSFATINARLEKDTLEADQITNISKFIDSHHPTILILQAVSKDVMNGLDNLINKHYNFSKAKEFVDVDRISFKKEYKPIIYDKELVLEISSGHFSPQFVEYNTTYSTYTIFKLKCTNQIFTVINIDLYSADPKTIEIQIFTITKHIYESNLHKHPIFLSGTINIKTPSINQFLSKSFKNLINKDKNNKYLSEDTFHDNGKFADGQPRDFIFLFDIYNKFQLNYARVLKNFDKISFKHYPLYAILTIK